MKRFIIATVAVCAVIALAGCASKKQLTEEKPVPGTAAKPKADAAEPSASQLFVKRVADNAVYAKDIVSKIDCTISQGDKEITVGGKLMMRRNEVIRLQLNVPIIGMEAGRLEFTPDYVLIVDRIHSEYVKGDYSQVDFLKANGLNYNTLQALFWNQLFVPGEKVVGDAQLQLFDCQTEASAQKSAASVPITLNRNNMTYRWMANGKTALIEQVDARYDSQAHGTTSVSCTYADFKPLGVKQFPNSIVLNMQTTAQLPAAKATAKSGAKSLKLAIKMKGISTDSDWEARTTVSKKYKEVSAEDVMKKLLSQ